MQTATPPTCIISLHLVHDFDLVLILLHRREIIYLDLVEEHGPAMRCGALV